MNKLEQATSALGTELLVHAGPPLLQIKPLRRWAVHRIDAYARGVREQSRITRRFPPGVDDDKMAMGLALAHTIERVLAEGHSNEATRRTLMRTLVQGLVFRQAGTQAAQAMAQFRALYGQYPPGFLVISPGKSCNLRCTGCYADAGPTAERLGWDTFDRIITEAKSLWGVRFFVISGGEPMAYTSNGKGLLDMVEKHRDCLFLMYTNGTLIDDRAAKRMAEAGNLTPALSVEGLRERTDARRGDGVFDKILAAMARLRQAGVPYGISMTATRDNCQELLSDKNVDFFFKQQGALYGFIFHYMPIGRASTLDLMPTPEQRLELWRRSWELIRDQRLFLPDFWNHGTTVDGCISAGRGYLYIDWNGAISPCVFVPYAAANINQVYARGGTLNDVWSEPFFADIRAWQRDYGFEQGSAERVRNWLAPCIIRDHYETLRQMIAVRGPNPTDPIAQQALHDGDYARGMAAYGEEWQKVSGRVWQEQYQRQGCAACADIAPLPAVPRPKAVRTNA